MTNDAEQPKQPDQQRKGPPVSGSGSEEIKRRFSQDDTQENEVKKEDAVPIVESTAGLGAFIEQADSESDNEQHINEDKFDTQFENAETIIETDLADPAPEETVNTLMGMAAGDGREDSAQPPTETKDIPLADMPKASAIDTLMGMAAGDGTGSIENNTDSPKELDETVNTLMGFAANDGSAPTLKIAAGEDTIDEDFSEEANIRVNETSEEDDTVENNKDSAWVGSEQTIVMNDDLDGPQSDMSWSGEEATIMSSPGADATTEEKAGDWSGTEATMLGIDTSASSGGDSAAGWDGSEQTMVGAETDPGNWDGNEATMVGTQADTGTWDGSEVTMVGGAGGETSHTGADDSSNFTGMEKTTTAGRTRTGSDIHEDWVKGGEQGPATGQTWGDYNIGGMLGQGGMGTVYRGTHVRLPRRAAVKILPPHLAANESMRVRFELEAQAASSLTSDHVVQVFDAGTHLNTPYYVMEFVEGMDLEHIIDEAVAKEAFIDPHEAADYIIQAGKGLVEAQRHNFVHRDIKPPNLMLTKRGIVKIADFGIVKVLGESAMTMTGTTVGTPAYISPEQGRGEEIDGRSDIYSLGIVFYELLTSKKPFDGTTPNALIYQHNYEEPELPSKINPDIPEGYEAVVIKCIQKVPEKRYQSAKELVDDLETIRLGNAPITAILNAAKLGTGADEMMKRMGLARSRLKQVLILAAVLIIVAGSVVWYFDYAETRREQLGLISGLREDLAPLNRPQALPKGSVEKFNQLKDIVGPEDNDVKNWQRKMDDYVSTRKTLSALDESEVYSAALLVNATKALDTYAAQFGTSGQDYIRWRNKHDKALQDRQVLRDELSELDTGEVILTNALWQRLAPALDRFEVMAGTNDNDAKRWRERYHSYRSAEQNMQDAINGLVAREESPNSQEMEQYTRQLEAFAVMRGPDDELLIQGTDKLSRYQEQLDRMLTRCAQLEQNDFASEALMTDIANDMVALRVLLPEGDLRIVRWDKIIENSQASIATHRERLARVDQQEGVLPLSLQISARTWLTHLGALISIDDEAYIRWNDRVTESEKRTTVLRGRLERLLSDDEYLSQSEIDRGRKAIDELEEIGGLDESLRGDYEQRLKRDTDYIFELRGKLGVFDEIAPISEELQKELLVFVRLVGADDNDARRWSQINANYKKHHSLLSSYLDQQFPIPKEAESILVELRDEIVGLSDSDVQRWSLKLKRTNELKEALAILDESAPLPDDADSLLQQLASYEGIDSDYYRRWLRKVQDVRQLQASLAELTDLIVAPQNSPAEMERLVELVSIQDPFVQEMQPVLRNLLGPGRPDWASDYGLDEFGIWAELQIAEQSMRMRYIPGGRFIMGSLVEEPYREADEDIVEVTITNGYWLAESELTQAFYQEVMGLNPSKFTKNPNYPTDRLSYARAQEFVDTVKEMIPGFHAQLPTEAQWEYACRAGGQNTDGLQQYYGVESDSEDPSLLLWYKDNAGTGPRAVKGRIPNKLGLFDMHGNVWEWVFDQYYNYSPTPVVDPIGDEFQDKIVRGGAWGESLESCRAANRCAVDGDIESMYIGMRLSARAFEDAVSSTNSLSQK